MLEPTNRKSNHLDQPAEASDMVAEQHLLDLRLADWVRYNHGGGELYHDERFSEHFTQSVNVIYDLKKASYSGVSTSETTLYSFAEGGVLGVFRVSDESGNVLLPERRRDVFADYLFIPNKVGVFFEETQAPISLGLWAPEEDVSKSKFFPILSDAAFADLELHKDMAIRQLKAARESDPNSPYPVVQPSFMMYLLLWTVAYERRRLAREQNPAALPTEWTPTKVIDINQIEPSRYQVKVSFAHEVAGGFSIKDETHTVRLTCNPFFGTLERAWEGYT